MLNRVSFNDPLCSFPEVKDEIHEAITKAFPISKLKFRMAKDNIFFREKHISNRYF